MAEIIGTEGSGITESAILKLDIASDLSTIVAAAKRGMAAESFRETEKIITEIAKAILEAHNLPNDPRGLYLIRNGEWGLVEGQYPQPDCKSFLALMLHFQVPMDSSAGYAASAVVLFDQIKNQSNPDAALALAFTLGGVIKEATLKSAWEKDALRGEKQMKAAVAGDEIAHGTKEARQRHNMALRQEYEELKGKGLKSSAIYTELGEKYGLNPKTIERKISRAK